LDKPTAADSNAFVKAKFALLSYPRDFSCRTLQNAFLKEEAIIFCKAEMLSWIEAELEGGAGERRCPT
jgi:hypothetical protein